jgi:hypothetical protein
MKHVACALGLLVAVAVVSPAWAAEQAPQLGPATPPAQAAGYSLAAAAANLLYFPGRFAVSLLTAELGGFTGWMTGGDQQAAHSVFHLTEGQAFITPAVLEGREPLRFGPWPNGAEPHAGH